MKTTRYTLLATAVAALLPVGSLLAADIVGSSTASIPGSNSSISVGPSQVYGGPHKPGYAGIGVSSFFDGKRVDFDGLAPNSVSQPAPANNLERYTLNTFPTNHGGLGSFDFVRVAGTDVWFGTWSDGAVDGNYQAYYVGNREGTTVPVNQTATYTVAGINNAAGVLNGSLTASFGGDNKLNGTLFNANLTLDIVDAAINASDASFSGDAYANIGNGAVKGATNGHFFGADAAALAGIAEFTSDITLNTAFGGTKN